MEYDDQLKNRIKRVEGQVRGILKMMDEGKECKELVSQCQLFVIYWRLADRAIGVVVSSNLEG